MHPCFSHFLRNGKVWAQTWKLQMQESCNTIMARDFAIARASFALSKSLPKFLITCWFAIHLSPLVKCLFVSSIHVLIGLLRFLKNLLFPEFLCICKILSFVRYVVRKHFLPIYSLFFQPLNSVFKKIIILFIYLFLAVLGLHFCLGFL